MDTGQAKKVGSRRVILDSAGSAQVHAAANPRVPNGGRTGVRCVPKDSTVPVLAETQAEFLGERDQTVQPL